MHVYMYIYNYTLLYMYILYSSQTIANYKTTSGWMMVTR